jgi:phospholipid/cholesterol/gamma-HCH transport system substrate-binding protein
MESKASYTLTGLFVVLLGIAMVVIAFWLSTGLSKMQYNTYIVYMNESVTGLNLNASVKYNGVDIGYVEHIELNPHDPTQVRLVLQIEEKVAVREDTRAILTSQGLTGVSFVNLKGGSATAPLLKAKPGARYPVIQAEPSLLFRLDTALRELSVSLTSLADEAKDVFDLENRRAFKNSLKNIDMLTEKLVANTVQFDAILNNTSRASTQLNITMQTVNQSLPQFTQILNHINALTSELQRQPSILLRGKAPASPGPGE